jgi:hypothetical protein
MVLDKPMKLLRCVGVRVVRLQPTSSAQLSFANSGLHHSIHIYFITVEAQNQTSSGVVRIWLFCRARRLPPVCVMRACGSKSCSRKVLTSVYSTTSGGCGPSCDTHGPMSSSVAASAAAPPVSNLTGVPARAVEPSEACCDGSYITATCRYT